MVLPPSDPPAPDAPAAAFPPAPAPAPPPPPPAPPAPPPAPPAPPPAAIPARDPKSEVLICYYDSCTDSCNFSTKYALEVVL